MIVDEDTPRSAARLPAGALPPWDGGVRGRRQQAGLKTAKALGLTIPQSLLQRADEVIQ